MILPTKMASDLNVVDVLLVDVDDISIVHVLFEHHDFEAYVASFYMSLCLHVLTAHRWHESNQP